MENQQSDLNQQPQQPQTPQPTPPQPTPNKLWPINWGRNRFLKIIGIILTLFLVFDLALISLMLASRQGSGLAFLFFEPLIIFSFIVLIFSLTYSIGYSLKKTEPEKIEKLFFALSVTLTLLHLLYLLSLLIIIILFLGTTLKEGFL